MRLRLIFLRFSSVFLLYCALAGTSIKGNDFGLHSIPIDGITTTIYNIEYPHQSLNSFSIIAGNPLDQFPFNFLPKYVPQHVVPNDLGRQIKSDSLFKLQVSAIIGSETGDLLLNQFNNSRKTMLSVPYNRDHFTMLAMGCTFPHTPLNLFFGYRYIDTYSDRFDTMMVAYTEKTKKTMAHSDEGLLFELVTGYNYSGSFVSSALHTSTYKRWTVTPYFFSPLFQSGYMLKPSVSFVFSHSDLYLDFLFDHQKVHYSHEEKWFTEYTDELWNILWKRKIVNEMLVTLSLQKNSKLDPSHSFSASINDTLPHLLQWNLSGEIYGNYHVGGACGLSYLQIPNITIFLNTSWDYVPKTRDYTFDWKGVPVEYHASKYETATFHSSVCYNDTFFFPASASLWLDYNEKPLWEKVEYVENSLQKKYVITQDTIQHAVRASVGGKASYTISLKEFNIFLWANAIYTPKNKDLRFSLPRVIGTDFSFGNPDNHSFYALLRFENRDRTILKYYNVNKNKITRFSSPAYTHVSVCVKAPIILPILKDYIRMAVQLEGGPFQFISSFENQRIKEHPLGNLIGPAFSLCLNGTLQK